MKYFFSYSFIFLFLLKNAFAQPNYQTRNYCAITAGFGMNSYIIEEGTLTLNVPYTQFDLSNNTTTSSSFSYKNHFSSKKLRSDLIVGMDIVYNKIFYECKVGGNIGNNKTTYLSTGSGLNLRLVQNRVALKIGAGIFYSWTHLDLGEIDNYQKDITVGGTTFYHDFKKTSRIPKGSFTTYDYRADLLKIMLKNKFAGLKTNVSLVFIPENKLYLIKFTAGYNFLIYHEISVDFTQYAGKVKSIASEDGPYSDFSTRSSYLNYQFDGNQHFHSPFNMHGLYFNMELGVIPLKLAQDFKRHFFSIYK